MVLAIEDNVFLVYRADVRHQRRIEGSNFLRRILEQADHLSGLPVDDGRRDEGETATDVGLLGVCLGGRSTL